MKGLFNLPPRSTRGGDSTLISKSKTNSRPPTSGVTVRGGEGLLDRIGTITALVNSKLGKYKDDYDIITTEEQLESYIDKCIENKIISIDTETTGLDPMQIELAGIGIYTPGNKSSYIPINHKSYITGLKSKNQIDEKFITEQFQRLADNDVKGIYYNAKYDIRVILNCLNVRLKCHWDGYIAARLLNENEQVNNLKAIHQKYCMEGKEDAFTFGELFKGIPFTHIPIKTGYLYAARDPFITYELYEFQKPFLTKDNPECIKRDLEGVAYVFREIEIPLIDVIVEMEQTGVDFDFELAGKLKKEYNEKLEETENKFYNICEQYQDKITAYRNKQGAANKLEEPINISSPTQVAILIYDILGIDPPDKSKPRGTGVAILEKIEHPISQAILEQRGVSKLLTTYIEKLPKIVNPNTGRIHASFNQMGADTGRFSSSDPNLQNIPSHNKDIRKMFKATDDYLMISSDYSAQEPRITAHMSKDSKMIQAYKEGKDLYVEVASIAFGLPYQECQEFRPDGTSNPEGKKRRNESKAIVLGVCYGKGVPAIAEDLELPVNKAQEIFDKIMVSFPGLPKFMKDSEMMATKLGYVETVWGRKRRLPKIQLPPYEFKYIGNAPANFDPLNFDTEVTNEVDATTQLKYTNELNRVYGYGNKKALIDKARKEGIEIKDNGGYIAEATRQCVNSRIQGSAADMSKIAMILVGQDPQMKELGFRLLIPVHDELIGEAPKENAELAAKRLSELMVQAASKLDVPSKCDTEITDRWFGEVIEM